MVDEICTTRADVIFKISTTKGRNSFVYEFYHFRIQLTRNNTQTSDSDEFGTDIGPYIFN